MQALDFFEVPDHPAEMGAMKYIFDGFELDTDQQELMCQGRSVAIAPKSLSVLAYLIENRGRMVTKSELLDQFWGPNVSEAALQTTMSLVRKALVEHGGASQSIKTYHARGFRFLAHVEELEPKQQEIAPDPIKAGHQLGEKRWFTVVTVRLNGLNSIENKESIQQHVDDFLAGAQRLVHASRGQLQHIMLDGFSASFGLAPHSEDGIRLALTCAHQITDLPEMRSLGNGGVAVQVGLDSGAAIVNTENSDAGWRLPGEVERSSAALVEQAPEGAVLVSQTIVNLMRDEIETDVFGDGFRLRTPPKDRAGLPARPLKRPSVFVGRAAEMAFLTTSLDRARVESGQAVVLTGPAGIGKSRLVTEFLDKLNSEDATHHQFYCLPRLHETPLALIRAMCVSLFRDHLGTTIDDPIDGALMRAILADAAHPDPVLEGVSDHQRQTRSIAVILKLLARICAERPRVLVFEDIHWIDITSRRYLETLLRSEGLNDLLIIMTTRPNDAAPLTESVLQLAPLGQSESMVLLREIPELEQIETSVVKQMALRAAGNPFFLEELALAAQTDASHSRDLPDTVQSVIEVRIGALEDGLRMVVYVVSVIGQPATPELIAHLLDMSEDSVAVSVQKLVTKGFLTQAETGFVFRHMLLNDAAYAMLAPLDRRNLHAKIASFFEANAKEAAVPPENLAWHFQEAGEHRRAIGYWAKASYGALVRSAQQEAVVFSNYGLALISALDTDEPDQEMRLRLSLAQAMMAMKGYGAEDVGTEFRRAYTLAQTTKNFKAQAGALVGLWVHTWVSGQLGQSLEYARGLLEMANASRDKSLFLQGYGGLGEVLTHTGKLTKAMTQLAAGLDVVGHGFPETITGQNAAVTCGAYAAWVSAMQGRCDDMRKYVAQSKDLTQLFENRFAEAIHLGLCSEAFMFAGDVETCLDLATQAVDLSREHDFPFWLGTGLVMKGWALGQQGDLDAGLTDLNEGITVFERTGAGVQLPNWYGLKAETLLCAGHLEEALAAAEYALSHAKLTGDIWFTPRINAVMAQILQRQNEADRASSYAADTAIMAEQEGLAASFVTVAGPR